jgi:hypothetical protein
MQLGRAIIGAIIGGAIGVAILIAIQATGYDQTWLAIIVALLTGLGVRAMTSTKGHASYLRGALTAILALAAFFGGTLLFSEMATRGMFAREMTVAPKVAIEDEDVDVVDDDGDVGVVEERLETRPPLAVDANARQPRAAQPASPWDFVWLTIAALVAYELGRGTSAPARPAEPVVPPPDAT